MIYVSLEVIKYFFIADSMVWEGIINGLSSIIISISLLEMLRYFNLIVPSTDFPSKEPHSVFPSNLPPRPVIMDLTFVRIEDISFLSFTMKECLVWDVPSQTHGCSNVGGFVVTWSGCA